MKVPQLGQVLFVLSLAANCIFLYTNFRNQRVAHVNDTQIQSIFCEKEVEEIRIERLNPDPVEELHDLQGNPILLNTIMGGKGDLILVIGDNSCGSCVDLSLNMLKTLISHAGFPKVIVLGYFENKREFFLLAQQFKFEFLFLSENSSLYEAANKGPVFFLFENHSIKSAFFPDSRFPILTDSYLKEILNL